MLWLYLIVIIYYILNIITYLIIHIKKNNIKNENANYNRLISLFNDDDMNEPLLQAFT